MSRNSQRSGYVHCACRDCMEIAIGKACCPANYMLCHDCADAGCDPEGKHECVSPDAYEGRSYPPAYDSEL